MCGIAGVVGATDQRSARERVQAMVERLRHRGPDGDSVELIPIDGARQCVCLGHTRLAILDLSTAASQPMEDKATGSWLVFNGEIFNYPRLRDELRSSGVAVASTGDTEVVLRLLIAKGVNAIPMLEGMFAFAFWDGRTGELLMARDTFGIKPLYYTIDDSTLVFASEVRAVRAALPRARNFDLSSIDGFLAYGFVSDPQTFIEGVRSLPAGTVAKWTAEGGLQQPVLHTELASLARSAVSSRAPHSKQDGLLALEAELTAAVERHLLSDVPLGISLSGGIDSTLLATYASRAVASENINLFTLDSADSEQSEGEFARHVARKLGLKHTVVNPGGRELFNLLHEALAALDQPSIDGVNTYVISRVAREHGMKVLLSGLGGDEIFGGYTTFTKSPLMARYGSALGSALRFGGDWLCNSDSQRHKLAQIDRPCSLLDAYLLQRSIRWRRSRSWLPALPDLPPDGRALSADAAAELPQLAQTDSYRAISMLESTIYMRNQLLRDSDVFSSAVGLEMRVPFLDVNLVRFAWGLPADWHVSGLRTKRMLKTLVEKQFGTRLARRRKVGFRLPWEAWLRGPLFTEVADTFATTALYDSLPFEPSHAKATLAAFSKGDPLVGWAQVFSLYTLLRVVARERA